MTTRLTWTVAPSTACWHAVEQRALGREPATTPADDGQAARFAETAAELAGFLAPNGIPQAEFFEVLTPAACDVDANRPLAHTTLTKVVGRARADALAERLAGHLTACETAYFAAFPNLNRDLELRYRPLRELFETRGPGLLAAVGRATDRRLVPEEARVAAVLPFGAAGGGWAAPRSNTVVFEMVLADPIAGLPETVRLAWLTSQLNFDLPDFAELLAPGTVRATAAWGMLPVVLERGADLDLVRSDDDGHLLTTAAEAWLPAALRRDDVDMSPTRIAAVRGWWTAARTSDAPWSVKLKGLEQLLAETA